MRQASIRRLATAGTVAILAATLAACGQSSGSHDNGSAAKAPDKVTFGTAGGQNVAFASHFNAVSSGAIESALKQFDTKLGQQDYGSGQPLIAAVASGDVAFAVLPLDVVLALNLKNRGLVGLSVVSNGGSTVLVGASKYKDSRGTDLAKYDGAKWGYTREGSQTQIVAKIMATNAGLDWGHQQGLALGSTSALGPALSAGNVDLAAMDPVSAAAAVSDGTGYVIANSEESSQLFPLSHSGTALVAQKSFVDKYPDLTQAVVKAEITGLLDVTGHIDDPAYILKQMSPDFRKVNGANWDIEWNLVKPAFANVSGGFTEATLQDTVKLTRIQFGVPEGKDLDTSAYINDYVKKAYASLGKQLPEDVK